MFNYEVVQSLNELELSLYDYIMKNSNKVIYMRIRELATEAHVSTTTISRFCKKVNCNGYSEFKVKFKMFMDEEGVKEVSDDTSEIVNFLKTIESKELDKKLEILCEMAREASNIIFIGVGTSGVLCKYAARYFSAAGKFAIHIDDPFYPFNFKYYENCLVIALSVSGETPTTLDHLTLLKQKGFKIVSITNSENCTIGKISDLNLSYIWI